MLRVTNDGGDFHVEVLLLSEVRGPASVAQTLYRETEESRAARLKAAEERKADAPVRARADRQAIQARSPENHSVPGTGLIASGLKARYCCCVSFTV